MAELISGKTLAAKLKAEAAAEAAELREKGVHARLAVVIVGENPASRRTSRCPGISSTTASSTPSRRTRTWTASPQ